MKSKNYKRESIETLGVYTNKHLNHESLDVQMLKEDLHLGILPHSLKIKQIDLKLIDSNTDFEKKLLEILPNQYYNSHSYNSSTSIIEFIETVCLELLENGTFFLELACEKNNNSEYHLIPFFADKIIERKDFIIQIFNDENQKKYYLPKKNRINKTNCFVFKWPEFLGGVSRYRKLIDSLSGCDVFEKSASLHFKSLQGQFRQYSFSEHYKILDEVKWKLTKEIGWHHRTYNDYEQSGTEHYKFARLLRFKKTQIVLRDYLIEKTKEIILQISNRFGLNVKLEINGLIALNEIEEAYKKWYSGELEYENLSEIVF